MHALRKCGFLLWLLATSLPPLPAAASIAYSSLDSSGGYNSSTGRGIDGSAFVYGYQAHADQFVAQTSGTISSIELAVHYAPFQSSPADQVNLSLVLDYLDPVYGHLPSKTSLLSASVNTPTPFGWADLVTFTPASPVALVAGQTYWLEVTPASPTTVVDWNASTGTYGAVAASFDGSTWGQNPSSLQEAFRIQVVPEPSVLSLAALGLLGLLRRTVRRQGVSLSL